MSDARARGSEPTTFIRTLCRDADFVIPSDIRVKQCVHIGTFGVMFSLP